MPPLTEEAKAYLRDKLAALWRWARAALDQDGPGTEVVVLVATEWTTQARMRVLPGVWGEPLGETERGTAVAVDAELLLSATKELLRQLEEVH
jgi:hypothetical protein